LINEKKESKNKELSNDNEIQEKKENIEKEEVDTNQDSEEKQEYLKNVENIVEDKENSNYNNNDDIFYNSTTMKRLISQTYLNAYEQLNNQLMRARQILIRELSKIFKLQKITGLQHTSGSNSGPNSFNVNLGPPSNNISSFLNNSISQVLHDTTSKIFGTSETEIELNNSIYNNPNFSLYEDITDPREDDKDQSLKKNNKKQNTQKQENSNQNISKTLPPRVKNSYLYNRNVMMNQFNNKYGNFYIL